MSADTARMKILITGAAGAIGRVLREGLRDRYDLRLMYHRTVLPAAGGEEVFTAGITDLDRLDQRLLGIADIEHLGSLEFGKQLVDRQLDLLLVDPPILLLHQRQVA